MSIPDDHPDFINALARGLSVIRCFGRGADTMTLSEVAHRTGLTRGTARRFLLTLEALGYVGMDGNTFRLLPKVLDLGYSYLASVPLWEKAQPYMKSIVDEIDESCSLAVLDGTDVVYLARVPPTHMFTIPVHVGTRMPAFVNAMGRVLLAELDEAALAQYFSRATLKTLTPYTVIDPDAIREILRQVRAQGYAMPEHEVYEGRRSLAVPIRSRSGEVVASMNISAMMSRASREDFLERFLPLLKDAATAIGRSF